MVMPVTYLMFDLCGAFECVDVFDKLRFAMA